MLYYTVAIVDISWYNIANGETSEEAIPCQILEESDNMQTIYKIENKINGRIYIGQTSNVKQRFIDHKKNGRNIPERFLKTELYLDLNKYGVENFNFDIIEECENELADDKERYWIKELKAKEKGYNASSEPHPMHDKDVAKIHGEKLRQWNNKMWQDEDYRRMVTERTRKHSKKMWETPEKYKMTIEALKKHSDSIKKTVYQYSKDGDYIDVHNGVREAERSTGVDSRSISKNALGQRKSAGGYVWSYEPKEKV